MLSPVHFRLAHCYVPLCFVYRFLQVTEALMKAPMANVHLGKGTGRSAGQWKSMIDQFIQVCVVYCNVQKKMHLPTPCKDEHNNVISWVVMLLLSCLFTDLHLFADAVSGN